MERIRDDNHSLKDLELQLQHRVEELTRLVEGGDMSLVDELSKTIMHLEVVQGGN